jgi:hypothetical protein
VQKPFADFSCRQTAGVNADQLNNAADIAIFVEMLLEGCRTTSGIKSIV